MVRLGDFEVIVNSPDVGPLTEFDDPDAAAILQTINGPGIVKYIQATADTVFSLKLTILPEHNIKPKKDVIFDVYVDSKEPRHGGRIFLGKDIGANGSSSTYKGRPFVQWGQKWRVEPLCFGPLHLTDDVAPDMQPDQVSAVGTLRIEVWDYKKTRKNTPKIGAATTQKRDIFSEENFKESSSDLLVNMDYPEKGHKVTFYDGKYLGNAPQATFILKYRSREALQMLGFIPRSPSPIPLERRDIDSLTIEEGRERLRQAQPDVNSLTIEELRDRVRWAEANNRAAAVKAEEQNGAKRGIKRRASSSGLETPGGKRLGTGAANGDGDIDNPVILDSDDDDDDDAAAARGDEVIILSDSEWA